VEIGEEALALTGVQLDGAEDVAELEAIDDHAGVVGKSAGLGRCSCPMRQRSGHVGEEASAVAGDDGEIEELAVGAQVELDEIDAEVCGQLEVVADLLGRRVCR